MSHYETSTTTGLPSFVTSATRRMKNVRINNRYENDGHNLHKYEGKNKQVKSENFLDLKVVTIRE